MFLLVFPSPCSERHATISFGRLATGVKRCSSRHIAQVDGVCTTGARERSQRARQPTLYPISCLSAYALSIILLSPSAIINSTGAHSVASRNSLVAANPFLGQCVSIFSTPVLYLNCWTVTL